MKHLLLTGILFASAAASATPGVRLDEGAQFNASNADCKSDTLTAMRQFRAEKHQISHDLCLIIASGKDGWSIMGQTPDLKVRVIGYTENGFEYIVASKELATLK